MSDVRLDAGRDAVTGYHPPSKTVVWGTPPEVFDPLHAEFNFTLDPCATPLLAKVSTFATAEQDGLSLDWRGHRVFLNPPYGRGIERWVARAAERRAEVCVGLLPARTDTAWFHEHVLGAAELRWVRGRVRFLDETGARRDPAPFPVFIAVWRRQP